ncbi:MAG: hypothetical protein CSA62_14070 [Planctomycetota bacterium]|nr:MAG: hypothetical protein CSA62_14070 [Planctomycetota bacterium]
MQNVDEHGFLGEDLLTWLWFRQEQGRSLYQIKDPVTGDTREVGLTISDHLSLVSQDQEGPEQTLRRGLPTRSSEATIGLRAGKKLRRARIVVAEDDEEWELTLDAANFDYLSTKCPEPDPDEIEGDPRLRDQARMSAFVRLTQLIDGIYRVFLHERLSPGWKQQVLPAMRSWVEERRSALV